jgi:hypothetical protein
MNNPTTVAEILYHLDAWHHHPDHRDNQAAKNKQEPQ